MMQAERVKSSDELMMEKLGFKPVWPGIETFKAATDAAKAETAKLYARQRANEAVRNGEAPRASTDSTAPRKPGIGNFAKELLAKGISDADVLAAVRKEFPQAKTTLGCMSYYRNKLGLK